MQRPAGHLHIIGAGLAGLATALYAGLGGARATLYEGTLHAGGRCRSYYDRELECKIDNGNHLMLSGNLAVMDYLAQTGATQSLTGPERAIFPFFNVSTKQHWNIDINQGVFPWWIFNAQRRLPNTSWQDYLSLLKLVGCQPADTMSGLFPPEHPLYATLLEPLTIAVHNTEPSEASAQLMRNVFWQSFGAGGAACMPRIPREGLSESLVDPALLKIQQLGVQLKFGRRLRGVLLDDTRIVGLDFTDGVVPLPPEDWVVLALPGWVMRDLLPNISAPDQYRSIVNAHYRLDVPRNEAGLTGLIGGMAQWVFVKPGVVSVTVSAADHLQAMPTPEIAARIWADVAALYQLDPASIPPHRIVKEKRATFAATPAAEHERPSTCTPWHNLLLAGDYTATGLPSTIEGSIRSGLKAAQIYLRWQ